MSMSGAVNFLSSSFESFTNLANTVLVMVV
jgi:hypothetical protein